MVVDGGEEELVVVSASVVLPAVASRMMQWFFCFKSMALSLSLAAKGKAAKLASSSFEREHS